MTINITLPAIDYSIATWELINYRDRLRRFSGIYILKAEDRRVLYVGKSTNLYARLKTHLKGKGTTADFFMQIARVEVILVPALHELDIYETHAINTLMPSYNRDKVHYCDTERLGRLDFALMMADDEYQRWRDIYHYGTEPDIVGSMAWIEHNEAFQEMRKWGARVRHINRKITELRKQSGIKV